MSQLSHQCQTKLVFMRFTVEPAWNRLFPTDTLTLCWDALLACCLMVQMTLVFSQALNIQGRLKSLQGQHHPQRSSKGSSPPRLALFAIATPLQPPTILEIRTKNMIFRTKHKLDFTPMACDAKYVFLSTVSEPGCGSLCDSEMLDFQG